MYGMDIPEGMIEIPMFYNGHYSPNFITPLGINIDDRLKRNNKSKKPKKNEKIRKKKKGGSN